MTRTATRTRRVLAFGSACVLFTGVSASVVHAATAPAVVTGVTVKGTQTIAQVTIGWKLPVGAGGARVVVVPGPTPTAEVADPRAVFSANVAAPSASVVWTGSSGDLYTVSVFAYDASGTAFAAGASARAPLPGPIRHLVLQHFQEQHVAFVTLPPHAEAAVLCYRADRIPTSPGDSTDCGPADESPYIEANGDVGSDLFFAVFSTDVKTGAFGPGVSDGDGVLPATSNDVYDMAIDATSLSFLWAHEFLGGVSSTFVDTRTWEVLWAAGTKTPVGNAAARRVVVATSRHRLSRTSSVLESYRVSGLKPGAPYTFAVRTINSIGETGRWSVWTAATRAPGAHLVDTGGPNGGVRSSPVPGPKVGLSHYGASLAVEPNGTAHTAVFDYNGAPGSAVHAVRAPGATAWRAAALPKGVLAGVRLATSSSAPGVIAIADRSCVRVRSAAGVWKLAGCMTSQPSDGDPSADTSQIYGLELDKLGAVHVLYSSDLASSGERNEYLMYATNASGRWVTRRASLLNASTGVAFTHDAVTDRLVLVIGELTPGAARHLLRVTSKAPAAVGFDTFSTRSDTVGTRAIVPVSVASFGGHITVVALRRALRYSSPGDTTWGTPVVLTGTSPATVGGPAPIPGAPVAVVPRVAAASAAGIVVAWSYTGFDENQQGTWSVTGTYPATGPVTWTPRLRLSASAYDTLQGLAVDKAGRSYALIQRR